MSLIPIQTKEKSTKYGPCEAVSYPKVKDDRTGAVIDVDVVDGSKGQELNHYLSKLDANGGVSFNQSLKIMVLLSVTVVDIATFL